MLSDYNIQRASTVRQVYHLPGGGLDDEDAPDGELYEGDYGDKEAASSHGKRTWSMAQVL